MNGKYLPDPEAGWVIGAGSPKPFSATRFLRLECDWRCNLSGTKQRLRERKDCCNENGVGWNILHQLEQNICFETRDACKSPEAMKQPCSLLIMGCLWDSCKPMSSATCQGVCSADNAPWMYLYFPKQTQPAIQVRKKTLLRILGSYETDILNSYPKLPNNSQTFVSCLLVHPISCSRSPWNRIVAKESGCRWSWAFHATTNEKCGSLCAENQGCVTLASDITTVSLPKRDVKNANDF